MGWTWIYLEANEAKQAPQGMNPSQRHCVPNFEVSKSKIFPLQLVGTVVSFSSDFWSYFPSSWVALKVATGLFGIWLMEVVLGIHLRGFIRLYLCGSKLGCRLLLAV